MVSVEFVCCVNSPPLATVRFSPKPSVIPEIIGSLELFGIYIQSVASGIPLGDQLAAVFQSELTEPFQILLLFVIVMSLLIVQPFDSVALAVNVKVLMLNCEMVGLIKTEAAGVPGTYGIVVAASV